jgi:hypothetical protein
MSRGLWIVLGVSLWFFLFGLVAVFFHAAEIARHRWDQ